MLYGRWKNFYKIRYLQRYLILGRLVAKCKDACYSQYIAFIIKQATKS